MAVTHSVTCILYLFLIMLHPIFSSQTSSSSSKTTSSDAICDVTPHPEFCKSELPRNKSTNVHDYGRLSIQLSSSVSRHLLSSINAYLNSNKSLSQTTISALRDCQFLLGLNIEFLSDATHAIRSTNTLQNEQFGDIETLLSTAITDLETCLDGLQATSSASSVAGDLSPSLLNGSLVNSISLALFKQGWDEDAPRVRMLTESRSSLSDMIFNRKLWPIGLSRRDKMIFESVGRRKLLQINGMTVNITQRVEVNPDGTGNYTTIKDAIAAAPNNTQSGKGYFLIYVVAGVYQEYVSIPSNKKYLMMVGDGINRTIITGNQSVAGGSTTFNSATFAVVAQGFVAVNITFRNTAGAINGQAVAMRSGADLSTFYSCSFEGYQDTLYTHSMRQFYRDCDIYGTIDYIFGNAAVVFQNCNIYSRLPLPGQYNTITAQGRTDINQNTGTSIQNCNVKAADDLASSNGTTQTYLGRPWKQYSRAVYMQSFMDKLINPAGWSPWSGDFALNTSYYAEYNNTGPGSNTTNRVTWPGFHVINATDAVNFTVSAFISGDFWLPATGVPYIGGLLQ